MTGQGGRQPAGSGPAPAARGAAHAGGVIGLYAARGLERGVDLRLRAAVRRGGDGTAAWPALGRAPAPPSEAPRPVRVGRGTDAHRLATRADRRRPERPAPGRATPDAGGPRGPARDRSWPTWPAAPGARRRLATAGLAALVGLGGVGGRALAEEAAPAARGGRSAAVAVAPRLQRYVVRPGDTLDGIAELFGVDPAAIAAASALGDPPALAPDQILVIPPPDLPPAEAAGLPVDARTIPLVVGAHRVAKGETLARIAADYGVDAATLAAFNGIEEPDLLRIDQRLVIPAAVGGMAAGVAPGAWAGALAPPPAAQVAAALAAPVAPTRVEWAAAPLAPRAPAAVFVPNVGTHVQERNLSCEYAAAFIATAAFGAPVPESVFLDQVPPSANPHFGYRGNIDGVWGNTDDYGVYADALVPVLTEYGFRADPFYGLGDGAALRQRLDAGVPVIVWLGYWGDTRERLVDGEGRAFSLAAGIHVVVAFGYDADGVLVSNPARGEYEHYPWAEFEAMWAVLDGMGLAVSPAA